MNIGGYEEGYKTCDYFWGKKPAEFVVEAVSLLNNQGHLNALDLGCGDGKNSNYLSSKGFCVTAVDISSVAIENAKRLWNVNNIQWIVSDIRAYEPIINEFDLVLATGSPHCLSSEQEVYSLIRKMKKYVRKGGYIVLYSFNDDDHDFSGHAKGFSPILLPHSWYINRFTGFEIVREMNSLQRDIHPDSNLEHHHSITRILAKKL